MKQNTRRWMGAGVGGVVGLVAGAIGSVNVVIFGGAPDGYQTGVTALFDYSPVLGALAAALLVAGPVIGVLLGLRVVRREG